MSQPWLKEDRYVSIHREVKLILDYLLNCLYSNYQNGLNFGLNIAQSAALNPIISSTLVIPIFYKRLAKPFFVNFNLIFGSV